MATLTDRERFIIGDLTTVFTPPEYCTTAIGLGRKNNVAWWGQTCSSKGPRDHTGCWPPGTEGANFAPSFSGGGFYSPGLNCPAGYRTACTAVEGGKSQWRVQFKMEPGETFVGCCPTGFNCWNLNGQTCISHVTEDVVSTASCQSGSFAGLGLTTIPNEFVTSLNLFAPMIQLAFKESDLPDRTTTTTSPTTTTSSSSSSRSSSGQSSSRTTTPGEASDAAASDAPSNGQIQQPDNSNPAANTGAGLSTGAVAGIAIGTAAFLLLILGAAFFVWRKRRQDHVAYQPGPANPPDAMSSPSTYYTGPYQPMSDPSVSSQAGEMKPFPHYFVPGVGGVAEMGQGHERFEAPGPESQRAEMFAGPREFGNQGQQQPLPPPSYYPQGWQPPQQQGAGYPGMYAGGGAGQGPVEMPTERYA
ncbi:hypothetical protein VTJ83DRAFT_4623 [Remersonia thermophila]|uniref:Uncharacterized protein n=1 Tax=Remersonia thermophila TaxID=72144 RepID=A0ABR4DAH7_9PEZI